MNVLKIEGADLAQHAATDKLLLVDFWATWCQPCKVLAPILEEIAGEMADRVQIVAVDIEEALEESTELQIRSAPTLVLMRNGAEIDRRIGGAPKGELVDWISTHA